VGVIVVPASFAPAEVGASLSLLEHAMAPMRNADANMIFLSPIL
jgi:hypothetical protein